MLRAILRKKRRDAISGAEAEHFYTIDFHSLALETELKAFGYGENGYEITELIGIETLPPAPEKEAGAT